MSQLYTDGILSLAAAMNRPGDYNQDGTVNAADYTVWRNNLGSATALPNDDTPGVHDGDYNRWKTHFGQSSGSGAASAGIATVPEPKTLTLFGVLAVLSIGSYPANRIRRATS